MAKQIAVTEQDQEEKPSAAVIAERKALQEIREEVRRGETTFSIVRQLLLAFDDRRGWQILGYASLASCVRLALDIQKSQTYSLIGAARVHRNILGSSATADNLAVAAGKEPISERLLRPIVQGDLSSKEQRIAWKQAHKLAARDSKTDIAPIKPKHVKEAVAEITGFSSSPVVGRIARMAKLREHIVKAIGLADLLAVDSSVSERLNEALTALDK